jgi:hypothetical protein
MPKLIYHPQSQYRNRFVSISLMIGTLFLSLSSGISISLRLMGFFLVLISFLLNLVKAKILIDKYVFYAILSICFCFVIGLLRTTLITSDYSEIYSLTITLVVFLPLLVIIYNSFNKSYIDHVIKFICYSIVILFFSLFLTLLIFREQFGPPILLFLRNYSGGFFYRDLFGLNNYPLVWFQASILAMPLAIYNLFNKNYKLFIFLSLIVFLSLNRTGSYIIIFFFLISFIKRVNFPKFFLFFSFMLPFLFLILCFILNAIYAENIDVDNGFSIRLGHVVSVIQYMKISENFFLGMGADSLFSTIGRDGNELYRDQEISFLEVFRRFGIFGYLLFNFGICITLTNFYNKLNHAGFYSLLTYVFFSFTNPSLVSIIFVIFYAIISSTNYISKNSTINDRSLV